MVACKRSPHNAQPGDEQPAASRQALRPLVPPGREAAGAGTARPCRRGTVAYLQREHGFSPISIGHTWITIRPARALSFPGFLLPVRRVNSISLITAGAAMRGIPPHPPASHSHAGRTCTVQPPRLCMAAYNLDLAGAGVIGACSHASPGHLRREPQGETRTPLPHHLVIPCGGGGPGDCGGVVHLALLADEPRWRTRQGSPCTPSAGGSQHLRLSVTACSTTTR